MASIPATTADEYLAQLPEDRRTVVSAVRAMVKRHLPKGYEEHPAWGMLCYVVPLARSGPTYNGQPLCYAAIAAQKNHYSLYLMGPYGDPKLRRELEEVFAKAGKRLDMGKSCVRFTSLDAIPLQELGSIISAVPVDRYIAITQQAHAATKSGARKATKASKPTKATKATKASRATKAGRKTISTRKR